MRRLSCLSIFLAVTVLNSTALAAQTISPTLFDFDGTHGSSPNSLIEAADGYYYGTTASGGSTLNQGVCSDQIGTDIGCGTIFRLDSVGSITVVKNFLGGADGASPTGLVLGGDGNLYGTTAFGGSSYSSDLCGLDGKSKNLGCGTIFEIVGPVLSGFNGSNVLYNFQGGADGAFPNPLVMGNGGVFYGSALSCSSDDSACPFNYGTLFSFTPGQSGTAGFKVLYTFSSNAPNTQADLQLAYPNSLLQGLDGNIYGTAQLGGSGNCLVVGPSYLGCGGVFEYASATGELTGLCFGGDCGVSSSNQTLKQTIPHLKHVRSQTHTVEGLASSTRPNVVIRQPGRRFPTAGFDWTFTSEPILLTEGYDGNIYGTTPPVYLLGSPFDLEYYITNAPSGAEPQQKSSIFQFVPPTSDTPSPALNTIYTFGGISANDYGSTAGLTLAGNSLYGLSAGEVFQLTPSELSSSASWPLSTLYPGGSPYADFTSGSPNSLMEGSDGNLYGTTSDEADGAVFKLVTSPTLTAPIELQFRYGAEIVSGTSTTLDWIVRNANSATAQQCYGFSYIPNDSSGWVGKQIGTYSNGAYYGSLTFTPTFVGFTTYVLTCGGTVSGFATLQVDAGPPPVITSPNLPNAAMGRPYSATLAATNGTAPYIWTIASENLPAGLLLSQSGVISGIPTQAGAFTFTLLVTDQLGDHSTASATMVVVAPSDANTPQPIAVFRGANGFSPNSLIQAQDGNFYGTTATGGSTYGSNACQFETGPGAGCGTVFRMDSKGNITILKSFQGADGASPMGLIQYADGTLYGTTAFGGSSLSQPADDGSHTQTPSCTDSNANNIGCGTIFKITTSGTFTSLYSFPGSVDTQHPNGGAVLGTEKGSFPNPLVVGARGMIYGSTQACSGFVPGYASWGGDAYPCSGVEMGVLFQFNPIGQTTPTILQTLKLNAAAYPNSLVQGSDGNLYGTSTWGLDGVNGANEDCGRSAAFGAYGCGNVFAYYVSQAKAYSICNFSAAANVKSSAVPNIAAGTGKRLSSKQAAPNIVIRQPGRGYPTGINPWTLNEYPMSLTEGKDGLFYGVTSPEQSGISLPSEIFSCAAPAIPPTSVSFTNPGTFDVLYSFTGIGDGGNSITGLTLSSDGNFYGVSGDNVLQLTPAEISAASSNGPLSTISPIYSVVDDDYALNSLLQGSDGNFYATAQGESNGGAVFKIPASPTLTAPVSLSLSHSSIVVGAAATLTWSVSNAFSLTAQQCNAFVQNATVGAGKWTGLQQGSVLGGRYSGSVTIQPTAPGQYTYALTCGGTESGFATLLVTPTTLAVKPVSLPIGTLGAVYPTTTLTAMGGVPPYKWGISVGSLPQNLTLSSAGMFTGTPIQSGSFSFTVLVSDSQSTPAKATLPLTLEIEAIASTPVFSVPAGTYGVAQIVTITDATGGATIYYTTDGTIPTTSSTKYTAAVTISATETLRAVAVAAGDANSPIVSASYVIENGALQFIAVTPCRIADTRNAAGAFGGPELAAGGTRTFNVPQSACSIPSTAVAYSLNATVVPDHVLGYLTVWPAGLAQPNVSTLNSDGRVKANATITPAGTNGGVSVFATDSTQFILDIDGYFVPAGSSASGLEFYPLTPCRVADTRNATGALGGPSLAANVGRAFPVQSSACSIPSTAKAYSLNLTAVPHGTLGYLTTWPTGQAQPNVSTLNASTGTVTANAAIVPAGTGGAVSIFTSDDADVIVDVNGYFAPPGAGGLSLYTATPCRALDTRNGAGAFNGTQAVPVEASSCAPPATAKAYVLNATVVPTTTLSYLSLWAAGGAQPVVSTLNASDGAVTSNMAIVPTSNGSVDAFASDSTQMIFDLAGYFAP